MSYISAASTISHQPTFRNAGFSDTIQPLELSSLLLNPDYKDFIDAGQLRRMSKILRMSVGCAKDCLEQAGIEQPDAILVGTGFGCLLDTEKFLNNSLTIEGLLPPTSFIQSTHNTMAGQISLSIGNHGYNMTHTQNALSFENALQDAILLLSEGENKILVGAADEHIEILDLIAKELNVYRKAELTSGASFFVISNESSDRDLVRIRAVDTIGLVRDIPEAIHAFLIANDLNATDLDLILFSGEMTLEAVGNGNVDPTRFLDYSQFSGIYPTSSSFAMHYASDKMQQNGAIKRVLICNNLVKYNLGLTLLESIEA